MSLRKFIALLMLNKKILLRIALTCVSITYPVLIYCYLQDATTPPVLPLLYPVVINLVTAIVFGLSLIYPPTLIERIARRTHPDLDARGVAYTRQVTKIWFSFSLINSIVSLTTVLYGDLQLWALYNGLISYVLMGILFAGEFIVRQIRRYRNQL